MKQVPNRKQWETKNAPEVEVVTDAMIRSPVRPRKQMECFEDMRKDDHDQTSSARVAFITRLGERGLHRSITTCCAREGFVPTESNAGEPVYMRPNPVLSVPN